MTIQKFLIERLNCIENIMELHKLEDIWLFDWRGDDEIDTLPTYREFIYPMLIFKGSKKTWALYEALLLLD